VVSSGNLTPFGKPTQNAFIEFFNVRLRDECLNDTLFSSPRNWIRRYTLISLHQTTQKGFNMKKDSTCEW
jgi:hypothetical protein